MELFDVYSLFDLTPVRAKGCDIWDEKGKKYLDLYGGHAVISVGHSHPHYVKRISDQLHNIGFYSNSVHIAPQKKLAQKLGELSGYNDFQLFLCNSGAEANENALKLASFHNGKKKVVSFSQAFHGRTSAAVAATDNPKIVAPINETDNIIFLTLNDENALEKAFSENEISSVIIEGIQGVGGIQIPEPSFLKKIRLLCDEHKAALILDEVQSGYGRTGKFFAHQYAEVTPDIITVAKGMGNGFPVAGVLISPKIKPRKGMLGTTFGGNYLACAAAIAVLEIMEQEKLLQKTEELGAYLVEELSEIDNIKEIRGKGLMIGIELAEPCAKLRKDLIEKHHILTGTSSQTHTLRILPPLTVTKKEINQLIKALKLELNA